MARERPACGCEHLEEAPVADPAEHPGGLRGVPADGTHWVHLRLCLELRPRRLLRLVARAARRPALPRGRAPGDAQLRARRGVALVLRRRAARLGPYPPPAKRSRNRDQHTLTATNSPRLTTNDHGTDARPATGRHRTGGRRATRLGPYIRAGGRDLAGISDRPGAARARRQHGGGPRRPRRGADPHNPTFWWGNFLLLDRVPQPGEHEQWVDRFAGPSPTPATSRSAWTGRSAGRRTWPGSPTWV